MLRPAIGNPCVEQKRDKISLRYLPVILRAVRTYTLALNEPGFVQIACMQSIFLNETEAGWEGGGFAAAKLVNHRGEALLDGTGFEMFEGQDGFDEMLGA